MLLKVIKNSVNEVYPRTITKSYKDKPKMKYQQNQDYVTQVVNENF